MTPPPHGPPSHSVQGGVGARKIQERQNVRVAQETIEALMGRMAVGGSQGSSHHQEHPDIPLPPIIASKDNHLPHCPPRPPAPQGSRKGPGGSGQCQRPHWKPVPGPETSFLVAEEGVAHQSGRSTPTPPPAYLAYLEELTRSGLGRVS